MELDTYHTAMVLRTRDNNHTDICAICLISIDNPRFFELSAVLLVRRVPQRLELSGSKQSNAGGA